jgi:hypothetical protein
MKVRRPSVAEITGVFVIEQKIAASGFYLTIANAVRYSANEVPIPLDGVS